LSGLCTNLQTLKGDYEKKINSLKCEVEDLQIRSGNSNKFFLLLTLIFRNDEEDIFQDKIKQFTNKMRKKINSLFD